MRERCFHLTRVLREFDPKLYAKVVMTKQRNPEWKEHSDLPTHVYVEQIHILEKALRQEPFWYDERTRIIAIKPYGDYVFALTDNWNAKGRPADWGVEPIIKRLQSINTQTRDDLLKRLEAEEEKTNESEARSRTNKMEDFLHEFHQPLRKAAEGINTALIKNDKKSEMKNEKRLRNRRL